MRAIDQRLGRAKEGHFYERKVAINFSSNSIIQNCGKTCFLIVSTLFCLFLRVCTVFRLLYWQKKMKLKLILRNKSVYPYAIMDGHDRYVIVRSTF